MRDWITKDFWWKLFSVILAVAVWVTIHKVRQGEAVQPGATAIDTTYNDLPVTIVSAGSDVHNYRIAPATVSVTVSGSKSLMSVLQANQIHAFVDLTGSDNTAKDLHATVQVAMPPGISLINVDPQRVAVIPPPPKTP
ncbi:MAG TPA: CdaR family protein [Verrucomicrobiae bacterium]|nr:CdaR family protein [Verrucomicrobiae bacterium]